MKTININLDVVSISSNTQPDDVHPCPRINVFQHPIIPENITKAGNYKYTFNIEDNGFCGVDVFTLRDHSVSINTDLPVKTRMIGQRLEQIHRRINIKEAGDYNISINIA